MHVNCMQLHTLDTLLLWRVACAVLFTITVHLYALRTYTYIGRTCGATSSKIQIKFVPMPIIYIKQYYEAQLQQ